MGTPYTVPGGPGQGDLTPNITWRDHDKGTLRGPWPQQLWGREGLSQSFSVTGQLTQPSPVLACWAPYNVVQELSPRGMKCRPREVAYSSSTETALQLETTPSPETPALFLGVSEKPPISCLLSPRPHFFCSGG